MLEGSNGKMYRSTQLEEHYVLIGEPGTYYLTHLSPTDGKGRTLAQEIFDFISNTMLCRKLNIVGTDGAALMTGKFNSVIRSLELHCNGQSAFCTPTNCHFVMCLWNLMVQLIVLIALLDQ